jgi:crossover junction endodeoxyribonuclease RusA
MAGVAFKVPGIPRPQGSSKWIRSATTGKSIPGRNPALANWRSRVADFAMNAWGDMPVLLGPLKIQLHFRFPRPKSHYGAGRNAEKLKPSSPLSHIQRPDLDKLVRAVFDGMTGIIFKDDSQITGLAATKEWSPDNRPGVFVIVEAEEVVDDPS